MILYVSMGVVRRTHTVQYTQLTAILNNTHQAPSPPPPKPRLWRHIKKNVLGLVVCGRGEASHCPTSPTLCLKMSPTPLVGGGSGGGGGRGSKNGGPEKHTSGHRIPRETQHGIFPESEFANF
jgi:hypothetical protein